MVNDPPLILADEPTGSLDTATGRQILAVLRELAEAGRAVVMVTHNPESAEVVDRFIEIRDGRCLPPYGRGHNEAREARPVSCTIIAVHNGWMLQ